MGAGNGERRRFEENYLKIIKAGCDGNCYEIAFRNIKSFNTTNPPTSIEKIPACVREFFYRSSSLAENIYFL